MTLPAVSPVWAIALALLAFGALGFYRGWIRELAALGGALLCWLVLVALGFTIVGWANHLALIISFTWQGGFDAADPAPLLRSLRASPPLDPWHPEWFYAVLFVLGVAASYLASGRLASRIKGVSDSVLGALAGALNGYVVSYVLLRYVEAAARQGGGGAAVDAFGVLGGYVTTVAIVVVVVVVAIALLGSSRGGALRSRRAGRAGG